jgi:hypothetical protein
VRDAHLPANLSRPHTDPHDHLIPAMRGHLPARHYGRMDAGSVRYTIRINGHLGATLLSAFPALTSRQLGAHTVLTGLLDQSGLFGVLAEIEALGLELIEVRQLTPECELCEAGVEPGPAVDRHPGRWTARRST